MPGSLRTMSYTNTTIEQFWTKKLDAIVNETSILSDCYKKNLGIRKTSCLRFTFEEQVKKDIISFTNHSPMSGYLLHLSVLMLLIQHYSGNDQVNIKLPVLESEPNSENTEGYIIFTGTLLPDECFKNFLINNRSNLMEAYRNQNFSVANLVRERFLSKDNGTNYFNVACFMKEIHGEYFCNDGNVDLLFGFDMTSTPEGIIYYNEAVYTVSFMEQMTRHYISILKSCLLGKLIKPIELDILSKEEKLRLLVELNNTEGDFPAQTTVHQLFEKQVQATPEAIAAVYEHNRITYSELSMQSSYVANTLISKGIGRNSVVGLLMEASLEMIIGVLAVLKAGGVYLPIDTRYPKQRINYILQDSQMKLLLVSERKYDGFIFNGEVISIHESLNNSYETEIETTDLQPGDMAYIIYTSGTTGNPKGVVIDQLAFVDFVTWAVKEYEHRENYQVLLSNSYAFDSSVQQIFPPLITGGVLHILNPAIRNNYQEYFNYLFENQINNMDEIPVIMNMLFQGLPCNENRELLPDLTCLSLGSEYVPMELVHKCRKYLNHKGKIINGYGPAEASVETTTYHFQGENEDEISLIGKPRRNIKVFVVDKWNRCCPAGVPGELLISGIGLAKGYLNREDLTKERFVKGINKDIKERVYMSGDLVRNRFDGNLEFLGRIDEQVKLNGYRIELKEIEDAIYGIINANQVITVLKNSEEGRNFINAYIVSDDSIDENKLRKLLSAKLPYYMIPSSFIQVREIPKTANGKIDKNKLLEIKEKTVGTIDFEHTDYGVVQNLLIIWKKILHNDLLTENENFFEVGGDSINIIRLHNMICDLYPEKVDIIDLFTYPTIKKQAQFIIDKYKNEKKPEQQDILDTVLKGVEDGSVDVLEALKKIMEE